MYSNLVLTVSGLLFFYMSRNGFSDTNMFCNRKILFKIYINYTCENNMQLFIPSENSILRRHKILYFTVATKQSSAVLLPMSLEKFVNFWQKKINMNKVIFVCSKIFMADYRKVWCTTSVNFPLWTMCCRYSLGVNMKFPVWPQKGGLIPQKTSYIPVYWEPGIGMQNGDLETYFGKLSVGWAGMWGGDRFGSIAKIICQAGSPPYWDTVTLKFARYSTITITRKPCHRTLLYFMTHSIQIIYTVVHVDSNVDKLLFLNKKRNKMYLRNLINWHNKSELFWCS